MRKNIYNLNPDTAKKILSDFLDVYFDKGFGVMNKTEIETLLYHVLKQNNLLSGKCFEDSLTLKITETKARKLIYESQVKYSDRKKDELTLYLRKTIGECLKRAYFSQSNKAIKFAIEDKYLRVALNAYLRGHGYFADTSFNTDIVSLDQDAIVKIVTILVPNYQIDEVLKKVQNIEAINDETKSKRGEEFWKSLIKDIMVAASVDGIKAIGAWIQTVAI